MNDIIRNNDNNTLEIEKQVKLPSAITSIINKTEKLLNNCNNIKENKKINKKILNKEKTVKQFDKSLNQRNNNVQTANESLPPINSNKVQIRKDLKREWYNKHVNEGDKELSSLTKLDWENEIAKHIVSMFASTKVGVNGSKLDNSKKILSYVDPTPGVLESQSNAIRGDLKQESNPLVTFNETKDIKKSNKLVDDRPNTSINRDTKINTNTLKAMLRPKSENNIIVSDNTNNHTNKFTKSSKFREVVIVKRKDGSEVALRSKVSVSPIWFITTGAIVTDFTSLVNGDAIQKQLDYLYEKEHYIEYLTLGSKVIEDQWIKHINNNENIQATINYCNLWTELILAGNAMAILSIERKKYEIALELLNISLKLTYNDNLLNTNQSRCKVRGYVDDTFAYYFYRRHLTASALTFSQKALELHEKCENIESIAQTLLQMAAVETITKKFNNAHKILYRFLTMIEEGRLAKADATPKQLCLVAIAYHNLAVVQLHLEVPDLACKSSMNARKIARLCLSHSNRWLSNFQWTHEAAVDDVKYLLDTRADLNSKQLNLLRGLVDELYSQHSPLKP